MRGNWVWISNVLAYLSASATYRNHIRCRLCSKTRIVTIRGTCKDLNNCCIRKVWSVQSGSGHPSSWSSNLHPSRTVDNHRRITPADSLDVLPTKLIFFTKESAPITCRRLLGEHEPTLCAVGIQHGHHSPFHNVRTTDGLLSEAADLTISDLAGKNSESYKEFKTSQKFRSFLILRAYIFIKILFFRPLNQRGKMRDWKCSWYLLGRKYFA